MNGRKQSFRPIEFHPSLSLSAGVGFDVLAKNMSEEYMSEKSTMYALLHLFVISFGNDNFPELKKLCSCGKELVRAYGSELTKVHSNPRPSICDRVYVRVSREFRRVTCSVAHKRACTTGNFQRCGDQVLQRMARVYSGSVVWRCVEPFTRSSPSAHNTLTLGGLVRTTRKVLYEGPLSRKTRVSVTFCQLTLLLST